MAMVTRTYKTAVCDFCSAEGEDVVNRKFELDGKRRQLEADDECFNAASVQELLEAGRQIRKTNGVAKQAKKT